MDAKKVFSIPHGANCKRHASALVLSSCRVGKVSGITQGTYIFTHDIVKTGVQDAHVRRLPKLIKRRELNQNTHNVINTVTIMTKHRYKLTESKIKDLQETSFGSGYRIKTTSTDAKIAGKVFLAPNRHA